MVETFLSPGPLSGSRRDMGLLVGREEAVKQVVRAVEFGINTLVLGPRGSGKTSLLHSCEAEWQRSRRRTAWISGAFLGGGLELIDAVAFALEAPRETYSGGLADTLQAVANFPAGRRVVMGAPNPTLRAIRELASRLGKGETGEDRPIVIVDELAPDVAHGVFGRARDELWSLPLLWVVAGDSARSADYLKPPADSFFSKVVDLSKLADADAISLLRARVGDRLSSDSLQRIAEQAGGNPRRLVTLAAAVLIDDGADATGVLDRDRVSMERLRALGPSAERLWAAIAPLGQVSAHDSELLEQLGWSRVRASKMLNELEKAGLVLSSTEKAAHGRPRKIYRPASGTITR